MSFMASVRRLLLAVSYDEECEALRHLFRSQEAIIEPRLDLGLLSCEPPVLQGDGDDEGRNISQSLLEDLLLYLVVRKFGATADPAGATTILGFDQQVLVHWERRDVQQPTELESFVKTLHGLLLKSEWNPANISTLNRVVMRLHDPRARQRFLMFAFQILRLSSQPKHSLPGQMSEIETKFFDEAVRLLLLGVTDLWSAIRKDCTKTAAAIAFEFSSQSHIEQFMDSLLCVAIGSRSVSADKSQVTAWTEREGALLALSVLLRSIKMDSTGEQLAADKDINTSLVKDDIKGILGVRQSPAVKYRLGSNGRHTLIQLPRCLVQTLKPAIYQCLRHDQLSVRQLAAQCLVEYASLCEEPTRLLIFQEVISKLNRINRSDKLDENDSAVDPNESELLDAFEAEGLLDVLARMAPCLPSSFLLKHWKFVFPTLEKYVMHIASSVRQKSSSVVLALAKQNLTSTTQQNNPVNGVSVPNATSDEASLKLMVQMLLSLSKKRSDGSNFCWQQKEGRLLSIDVLMNVLGESLLVCGSDACKLVGWKLESTKRRQRRSSSLADLQTFLCAHDQAQSATWVLDVDTDGAEGQQNSIKENGHDKTEMASLVHAISTWIEKNSGQNDLPASSHEFWQQVLSGCITQTKEAFESSQFELRRISRQVLPGLIRLVIWTEQLEFISSTELKTASVDTSWSWTCVKYILLHLRYLDESRTALGESLKCSVSQKLATNWETVWNGITALESSMQNLSVDADTIVAQMEVKVMAFLSFGAAVRQVTRLLDGALRTIHAHLPESMQLRTLMGVQNTPVSSGNNSLDRQFCIFMVPILPAVVTTLQYVTECHESTDASTNLTVQPRETDFSWISRWRCLERIVMAWLLCDDMFRWITLSKAEAHSQLLDSLSTLLRFSKTELSPTEESEETDIILHCLRDTFTASQAKGTRMKDTTYVTLVEIYLRLWLRSIKSGSHNTVKVIVATAQIYSQRQQYLTIPGANAKPAESNSTGSVAGSWGDWDDEEGEIQQASPVGNIQELHSLTNSDSLFQGVLESLDASQLSLLCETARALPDLRDVPSHHFTRMQQQIEACLRT